MYDISHHYRGTITSAISKPVWGKLAMVRWGKGDWLYVVGQSGDPDSSFNSIRYIYEDKDVIYLKDEAEKKIIHTLMRT